MFVMTKNPKFETEATGIMPGDRGEAFSFRAHFAALGETERKAFDLNTEEGTTAFLLRVFIGMDDVLDAENKPLPFIDETRDWMIDQPHIRMALIQSYFSSVYKAALGN